MFAQSLVFFDTKKNNSKASFLVKATGLLPKVQISPPPKKAVEGGEVGERRVEINNGTRARDEATEAHSGIGGCPPSPAPSSSTVSATITQRSTRIIRLAPLRQTY